MTSEPRPFQRATVDAAIKALKRRRRLRRFLVADEVGLGKTVVAREVVRRLSDDGAGPLRVFYVTSGRRVADQNKARLLEFLDKKGAKAALSPVDRLGLMTTEVPAASPLRLYALTTETSFPETAKRLQGGTARERAFIRACLERSYPGLADDLDPRLFQGQATTGWPWAEAWAKGRAEQLKAKDDRAFVTSLAREFGKPVRLHVAAAARTEAPGRVMGRLRRALAHACLLAAPPDLIVFDEFQKYRRLFAPGRDKGSLAAALLDGPTGEGGPPMLLLSATPYRLYAERWEEQSGVSPHREFFELIAFLGGQGVRASAEAAFRDFGELLRAVAREPDNDAAATLAQQAGRVRDTLQAILGEVMSRTERATRQDDESAETTPLDTKLKAQDIDTFRQFVEGVADADRAHALPYWLSTPLPAQALGRSYQIAARARFKADRHTPLLTANSRYTDRRGGWGSPKLRALQQIAPAKDLALPWLAPSLPWWPLEGAWKTRIGSPKLLLFSRFRATPQAIAALTSLEVERTSLGDRQTRLGARVSYEAAWRQQHLQARAGRGPVLGLFHPSPFLIRAVKPLQSRQGASVGEVRKSARRQLIKALGQLGISSRPKKVRDIKRRRPAWKLLAAIERRSGDFRLSQAAWETLAASDAALGALVDEWRDAGDIAFVSPDELKDLTELALAGPGVVTGRALLRHHKDALEAEAFAKLVNFSWRRLRRYLDNPVFAANLPGENLPKAILKAVVDGGLEATLDEHFWLAAARAGTDGLIEDLGQAMRPGVGGFSFRGIPDGDEPIRVRCHAALSFGGGEKEPAVKAGPGKEDDEETRTPRSEEIRESFNTPFWPHLLATTSVGQEGLDFHSWCDRVAHWDLCSNPVDLEQREGRIQRFGGLAIRRKLAEDFGTAAMTEARADDRSPWTRLEHLANAAPRDDLGLQPWWTLRGARIHRYVFELPLGRDRARFEHLRAQRLLYRLALGQPNQEDLVNLLALQGAHRRPLLLSIALDLSAFRRVAGDRTPSATGPEVSV